MPQSFSTWQVSHLSPNLPLWPLRSSSFLWQATHFTDAPLNDGSLWHSLHGTSRCLPVSGKCVLLWSKFVSFQFLSVWQSAQESPSLPLCLSSLRWQAMQLDGASRDLLPLVWEVRHRRLAAA